MALEAEALSGEDDAELRSYLPPVLRHRFFAAVLLPGAGVPADQRALYPVRMTLALLAVIVFSAQSLVFVAFGRFESALADAVAAAVAALGTVLLRRGRAAAALLLGWGAVAGLAAYLYATYGASAQIGWFLFPTGMAAYFVYRPEEWAQRIIPLSLCLVLAAAVVVPTDVAPRASLSEWESRMVLASHVCGALYATLVLASHAAVFRDAAQRRIAAAHARADKLLLNILPAPVAARLMKGSPATAESFADASVLFADLVGFTRLASSLVSNRLVELLNEIFTRFDALAAEHGLEKIKTIGDAYMVVGGLPVPSEGHASRMLRMATGMLRAVNDVATRHSLDLRLRIGVHLGPVTAGVIGQKKFAYDLWGDTVNVASRMESLGEPGRVHVSRAVYERLKDSFAFVGRRSVEVKGKGAMETWFLSA